MSKKLSDSLSQFISTSRTSFDNPFDESEESRSPKVNIDEFIEQTDEIKRERKANKPKKKKGDLDDLYERTKSMSDNYDIEDMVDDFDGYIEEYLLDDEDEEFRRNLVRYGRKYARDTRQTGESSEIQKAYAEAETALDKLIKEVSEDKDALQRDITQMRTSRSRNYKSFADLIEAKTSLHSTQLNAIKEMNSITKTKFDLQMKSDKTKKDEEGDSSVANRMIQNLFSVGRDNLIGSYAEISGSAEAGSYEDVDGFDEMEYIENHFSNDERGSDGDKFLKYENIFSHYVLEYDDDGPVQIVAEDKDGNVIPDYPVDDPKDLEFSISENTGTATDNLSQQYRLRKI